MIVWLATRGTQIVLIGWAFGLVGWAAVEMIRDGRRNTTAPPKWGRRSHLPRKEIHTIGRTVPR